MFGFDMEALQAQQSAAIFVFISPKSRSLLPVSVFLR